MGVLDSVFGEITKWLLQKADKRFGKQPRSYRDRVLELYEVLYTIDETLEKHHDKIFSIAPPILTDIHYSDIRLKSHEWESEYQTHKKWVVTHMITAFRSDHAINLYSDLIHEIAWGIDRSIRLFNDITTRITLESQKNKQFWDGFISDMESLKSRLNNLPQSFLLAMGQENLEEFRSLVNEIRNLKLELQKDRLKKYIKEIKNYINSKYPPSNN